MVRFHFVATPIGNLGDLTFRALDTLKAADVVFCEDTRHSRKLMSHFGLSKKLISFHDFSGVQDLERISALIADGQNCVYISDAGTPMLSDPGYEIARFLEQAGIPYDVIPGANAVLPALQLSGLPCDRFCFCGFLGRKESEIEEMFHRFGHVPATLVYYQSPKRIRRTIQILEQIWPDREIAVLKELTKLHQQVKKGLPATLIPLYTDHEKGEFVLVIAPPSTGDSGPDWALLAKHFLLLVENGMSRKGATRYLARTFEVSSKELYARSMDWDSPRA